MRIIPFLTAVLLVTRIAAQSTDTSHTAISVYLTFDDGPMKASKQLVNIIQQDSIPVTVFLVGRQVIKSRENNLLFQWYQSSPFIEIANHSYSHANGKYKQYYQSPLNVVNDVLLNEEVLGITNKAVRLPGRNVWRIGGLRRSDLSDAVAAADSLSAKGYNIFGWDIEWCYDSSGKTNYTAEQMMAYLRFAARHGNSFMKEHIVILCHDSMLLNEQTYAEFGLFIRQVKADPAFAFRHISSYPVNHLFATY